MVLILALIVSGPANNKLNLAVTPNPINANRRAIGFPGGAFWLIWGKSLANERVTTMLLVFICGGLIFRWEDSFVLIGCHLELMIVP